MNIKEALEKKIAFKTLDELLKSLGKTKNDIKNINLVWYGRLDQDFIEKEGKKIEFYHCCKCDAYIIGRLDFSPPRSFMMNSEQKRKYFMNHCPSGEIPTYSCIICGNNLNY